MDPEVKRGARARRLHAFKVLLSLCNVVQLYAHSPSSSLLIYYTPGVLTGNWRLRNRCSSDEATNWATEDLWFDSRRGQ